MRYPLLKFGKHVAALFYSSYLAFGIYTFAIGQAELLMTTALIIPLAAIMALYGFGGPVLRTAGLIIGALAIVVGVGQFAVFAFLLIEHSMSEWAFVFWGLAAIVAGSFTIQSIRHEQPGWMTQQQENDIL